MNIRTWVYRTLVSSCIALGIIVLVLVSCRQSVEYWRFSARGQDYYAQVAEACDGLLAQHAKDLPCKMAGDKLTSLPLILRGLAPSFVMVDTNCVSVLIGGGFNAYHILWVSSDGHLWNLRVYRGGPQSRVVFSKVMATH